MATRTDHGRPPATRVAAAFGLGDSALTPLSGGQNTVWRAGSAVLKRLDTEPEIIAWQERVLCGLDGRSDFRVAPPLRSLTGDLVVDGWTAWRYEPGRRRPRHWAAVIEASASFHAAVEHVPRPEFIARREDRWAVGDRVAWGEVPPQDYLNTEHIAALTAALRPIDAPRQLIHGDLTGNVLFAEGLPPLVIDLSPYWRPPATAIAIIVADALVFEGADSALLSHATDQADFPQYFLRALIYRAVADRPGGVRPADRAAADDPYRPAVELALRLAGH